MKQILIVSLLFLFFGCSSEKEKITSGMEPFMTENFPDTTYEIVVENSLYQLVINDGGNLMNRDNYEPIVAKIFSEFYKVFLMSTKGADAASKFEILYENDTLTWKSERLTLGEISEVYRRNVNS